MTEISDEWRLKAEKYAHDRWIGEAHVKRQRSAQDYLAGAQTYAESVRGEFEKLKNGTSSSSEQAEVDRSERVGQNQRVSPNKGTNE